MGTGKHPGLGGGFGDEMGGKGIACFKVLGNTIDFAA